MFDFSCHRCGSLECARFQSCPRCKMPVRSSSLQAGLTVLDDGSLIANKAGITYGLLSAFRSPSECIDYYDGPLAFFFQSACGERYIAFDTSEHSNSSNQTFLIQAAPEGPETDALIKGKTPLRRWMLRLGGAFEATLDHKNASCRVYWFGAGYITKDQAPWDEDLCI